MSSSKLSSIVILLSFALLLRTSFGADTTLFHFCSSSGNFTAHSPFELNLKRLITLLNYKTPPTGFGLGSVGRLQSQTAYGLSLCRGDVSASDCRTCVSEASSEIRKLCPYNKGAIIWHDKCMYKYLDADFFGQVDETNKFYMWNLQTVSDPATFNYKTKELLSQLAYQASVKPKMFATGEVKIGESKTLYGLTQCTRDLSGNDCKKCLDDAISELPNCCDGKQGGRVVGGSCNFRYEIYPFVKQ
ncbi:cysteine-rich repeat secretory protein 38-like [Prosopis cineraria]|uniref:cysteine-rich repeat secretory protein 38-like n=1 Tax=Prosopis cineraria TaxID=364024 RepID=UPI00240F2408|nr:cysteine-rich repeat secretory protein 38-like [Prosopis cineraria]XP_054816816.1 cysteine-rich repeat secretory protein 38-like [Prosopis cineraria]